MPTALNAIYRAHAGDAVINSTENTLLVRSDCKRVLATIPNKSVNVIIIDPPYGAQTQNNNEWDIAWTQSDWDAIVSEVFRVLMPGGHFVVFSGGKTLFTIHAQIHMAYKTAFKIDPSFYHMVWNHDSSDSCTVHSHIPRSQFEDIMVYFRTGEGKIMEKHGCLTQTHKFFHHTGRSNVFHCYKDDCRSKPEKTIQDYFTALDKTPGGMASTFDFKPEQLMKYLVRDYTHKDGLVVDFCMRHGITGVAALGLNRRFIGVELDRGSYELAKGRLADRFALTWSDGRTSGSSVDTLVPFSPVIATPVMVTPTPLLETPPTIVAAKTRKESIKKPTPGRKTIRKPVSCRGIYDALSIVGKRVQLGTPKRYVVYMVKEAIPSIEKKGGRYKVFSADTHWST